MNQISNWYYDYERNGSNIHTGSTLAVSPIEGGRTLRPVKKNKEERKIIFVTFLTRDAFVRTNRRAVAMMFVRPSVWDGRAL